MTPDDALTQFHRLLAVCVVPADPDTAFDEWFAAFERSSVDDVADGITRLLRAKTDRFLPSIGELRGAVASVQSGRETSRCATCHGSRWVEARPFRANGDRVYEGVRRCPDCGVPPPTAVGAGHQTPLSESEYRAWLGSKPPVEEITSRTEFFARVRAIAGRKLARVICREVGEEG